VVNTENKTTAMSVTLIMKTGYIQTLGINTNKHFVHFPWYLNNYNIYAFWREGKKNGRAYTHYISNFDTNKV
jgi:hypothetical protein